MLRNKHRAAAAAVTTPTTTKQSSLTMADPKPNHSSSLFSFSSPKFRFFTSIMTSPFDSDFSLISPTSILEPNSSIFSCKTPKPTSYSPRFHPPDAFGLADLVKNGDTHTDHSIKPLNKMVLFGSKLRVQIPSADFGTKTGFRYPPAHGQLSPCLQTKVLTGDSIPDQTEDYTCVISHGPNPTITHIFDNSVFVETTTPCSAPVPPLATEINNTNHFLSYCYTCKKTLDHKQDIYIYRGDKGFCSSECRSHEMLLDQMDT